MKRFHVIERYIKDLPRPIIGAEVGVREGKTACYLMQQVSGLYLHMIDPYCHEKFSEEYIQSGDTTVEAGEETLKKWLNKVTNIASHTKQGFLWKETSLEAAKRFDNQQFDFVFIDGEHTYNAVANDLQAWYPKVKKGGLLFGHDYINDKYPGVKQAWDEFAEIHNLHLETDKDRMVIANKL